MSAQPVSLRPHRLRIAAALVALALAAAIIVLWPARRDGVVLYATSDGAAALAQAFARENGIPVHVVRLSTGPMLARIAAEAERPAWTLAWVDGDIPAAALDRAGLLEHGTAPSDVPWTGLGRALLPASGAWVPMGVTLAGVAATRGTAGRFGMPDPAISGPAFPELAGFVADHGGWPRAQAALRELRDMGLTVAPTSPAVMDELHAGRIGSALIQSSTAYAAAAHDPTLRIHVPAHPVLMPGVVMMARNLPPARQREARAFIRFLLSPRAHAIRIASGATDSYYWPIVRGLAPVPALPPFTTIHAVRLDPYRWAPLQARITDWFEEEMARR